MQTTKQQLLVLLKRTGAVTVDEAAGALSVASMTARQHLVGLERDGLVVAEKVRRLTWRPHYLYTLTPKGEEMFPRRFDLFAQVLLEEVGALNANDFDGLAPEAKQSLLVQRTADRLAERFRPRVDDRSLAARVASVTDVLHFIGGFAEWRETDDGYEIRDYNCVFARLAPAQRSGCPWHVRLLTGLLSWPVSHEIVDTGHVHCCRYLVERSSGGGRGEGLLTNG